MPDIPALLTPVDPYRVFDVRMPGRTRGNPTLDRDVHTNALSFQVSDGDLTIYGNRPDDKSPDWVVGYFPAGSWHSFVAGPAAVRVLTTGDDPFLTGTVGA